MYEHHAARIHRFCVRRLGDRDEAADAVQDTFLRAWLALENGVEVRHPLSWLLTIADNVCVSRFRARSARVATTELSEETRGDFTDAVGEVAGLAAALRALPVRQRQALLRREVQGYSYDEIGAELGASRASVAALLHRARLAVADALREARRGVAALVPVPAILRAPFEGGAAAGVAIAGTTTVIAVAQLAGAGPTPSVAAPPSRPAGALAASVEPGRLARPTTVQTAGTWARAARARSSERAGVLGTAEVARTGPPSQELREPLPESSSSEDLGGGPTTHGEPGSPPVAEPEAPGPGAGDPELHAEPEPTQSSDRPDSQGAATPPGKQEKGAKGRSTSAPGHAGKPERPADEPSGGSGDTGEAGGESPSLPPQARGNGPPARDDTRDVSPPGKAGGEPEPGSGPGQGAAQGNGGGQGSGRGQDKDDGAGKGGSQGKGGGPPSGPSP